MDIQAILDEPTADDLRLIYADWLEDHDAPERAALIRSQVADPKATCIITSEKGIWLDGIYHLAPRWCLTAYFQRGFIAGVHCTIESWCAHHVDLLREYPLQYVTLRDVIPHVGWATGYRWTVYPEVSKIRRNHWLSATWLDSVNDLRDGMWSEHETKQQAYDWLSAQLIAKAKHGLHAR